MDQEKSSEEKFGGRDNGENEKNARELVLPPVDEGIQIICGAVVNRSETGIHPQPTSDPLDPLNWSKFQKHVVLSTVMLK